MVVGVEIDVVAFLAKFLKAAAKLDPRFGKFAWPFPLGKLDTAEAEFGDVVAAIFCPEETSSAKNSYVNIRTCAVYVE